MLILILLLGIVAVKAIHLQINAGGALYNTNTFQNYQALMGLISTSQDPEIKQYYKELDELNQLTLQSPGMLAQLIGPNLFVGAKHVLYQFMGRPLPNIQFASFNNAPWAYITKVYIHPNSSYDLAVFTTNGFEDTFLELKPMRRYVGDLSKADCFALSDALHNQNGQLLPGYEKILLDGEKSLHTKGRFASGQNLPIMNLVNFYRGPKIQSNFYGGDSGAPVFIKVSATGDLQQDYSYIGFNETGNPLKVVNVTSPGISNWITNTVISIALDQDNPNYIKECLSNQTYERAACVTEGEDVAYQERLFKTYQSAFCFGEGILNHRRGGFFMGPSWLIGLSGEDISENKNACIKKIAFSSLNEYKHRNNSQKTYQPKKIFDLKNGLSIALLIKPVLGSNEGQIIPRATTFYMHKDLAIIKKYQQLWTESHLDRQTYEQISIELGLGRDLNHVSSERKRFVKEWSTAWADMMYYGDLVFPDGIVKFTIIPDDLVHLVENKIRDIESLNNKINNIMIQEAISIN